MKVHLLFIPWAAVSSFALGAVGTALVGGFDEGLVVVGLIPAILSFASCVVAVAASCHSNDDSSDRESDGKDQSYQLGFCRATDYEQED